MPLVVNFPKIVPLMRLLSNLLSSLLSNLLSSRVFRQGLMEETAGNVEFSASQPHENLPEKIGEED